MRSFIRALFLGMVVLLTMGRVVAQGTQSDDGDGIPMAWKKAGFVTITLANGSVQRLDLTKDGPLTPGHKDVFVWVAWMEDKTHTHKPDSDGLKIVKSAFADAPIANSDGSSGIRLHIYYNSQPLQEVGTLGKINNDGTYNWAVFDLLKKQTFPKELNNLFHFCIFAHDIDAVHHSGISKYIGGYDFIVSLGAFGVNGHVADSESQAGTFMHELGHNLGLRHGGGDDINYKPNYVSVMNYFFQLTGIPEDLATGNLDYSRFLVDENENQLDRKLGLNVNGALGRYGTQYFCSAKGDVSQSADSIAGPIDWDCSGGSTGITSQDSNGDGQITGLSGFNDWEHVQLIYANSTLGVSPNLRPLLKDELTVDEANKISIPPVPNVLAVGVSSGVLVSWKRIPLDRVVAYKVIRKSHSGEEKEVGVTEGSGLLDENPPKGSYSYYVRGLYTLLGNPARDQLLNVESLGLMVEGSREIAGIREQAPKGIDRMETMGLKPAAPKGTTSLNLLIETSLSRPAGIEVQ